MIKVGIIGATGYAGSELVRLITQHPKGWISNNDKPVLRRSGIQGSLF